MQAKSIIHRIANYFQVPQNGYKCKRNTPGHKEVQNGEGEKGFEKRNPS